MTTTLDNTACGDPASEREFAHAAILHDGVWYVPVHLTRQAAPAAPVLSAELIRKVLIRHFGWLGAAGSGWDDDINAICADLGASQAATTASSTPSKAASVPMCESCDDPAMILPDGSTGPCQACQDFAGESVQTEATTASASMAQRIRDEVDWENGLTQLLENYKHATDHGINSRESVQERVIAYVLAGRVIAPSREAAPMDERTKQQLADVLNTTLWLYRRLPQAYGSPPFVDKALLAMAEKLSVDVPAAIKERAAIAAQQPPAGKED